MDLSFSKLKLNGFKSFVDQTEFDIFPGLTGIVGPNGCGKSNLLEAIKWVMGESRPSSLRGMGMDEVIFDGAGSRTSKNYAEVSIEVERENLTSDDIDKKVKIEIVRRVTRNMGSTYRVDGTLSRLKDIQMIFADASTGAHSPSLVKQGQITDLINSNPKSRRLLLEEAAGISGLYQRRHESELKLKATEGNLNKVQDVLDNLNNQLHALSKQANQAQKFKYYLNEIDKFKSYSLFFNWEKIKKNAQENQIKLSEIIKKINIKEKDVEKYKLLHLEEDKKLPLMRDKFYLEKSSLERSLIEKESLNNAEAQNLDLLKDLKQNLTLLENDKKREENLLIDSEEVIKKLNLEKLNIEEFFSNIDFKISNSSNNYNEQKINFEVEEKKLEEESLIFFQLKSKISDNEDILKEIQENGKNTKSLIKKTFFEIQNLKTNENKLKVEIEKFHKKDYLNKENLNNAIESLKNAFNLKDKFLQKKEKLSKELFASNNLINSIEQKILYLKNLILKKSSNNSVLNELKIEKGYEKALVAALKDDLNFPALLEIEDSGWKKIEKKEESFNEDFELLINKVKCPEVLFNSLRYVAIVDKKQGFYFQKYLKPGQRLVSLSGDLWRWDGFICLAKDFETDTGDILQWRKEVSILETEFLKEKTLNKELEKKFKDVLDRLKTETSNEEMSREKLRKKEKEIILESQILNNLEMEMDLTKKKILNNNLILKNFNDEENLIKNKMDKYILNDEDLERFKKSETRLESLKKKVENIRKKMIEKSNIVENFRRNKSINLSRLNEINQDLINWENRKILANERLLDFQNRKKSIENELLSAKAFPNSLNENKKIIDLKIIESKKKCLDISTQIDSIEDNIKEILSKEKVHLNILYSLKEDFVRIENQVSNLKSLNKEIEKEFVDNFNEKPEIFFKKNENSLKKINVNQIESKIEEFKLKRDNLGEVNLRAENDSIKIAKEYEELEIEKDDISKAVEKLRKAISDLNKKGKDKLNEAFEKVNNNFSELFRNLFDGGEAKLKLIYGEDPLDTGLEIMCQPPGKKLSNLSLLSGGEQTLAALSLILGVFLAKPSPICVLDEVDAPLDESNVIRFCKLLDVMKQKTKTKFLIITHNAITMSKMDRLYGVTMVEKGVSRLVSVDLTKAENLLIK